MWWNAILVALCLLWLEQARADIVTVINEDRRTLAPAMQERLRGTPELVQQVRRRLAAPLPIDLNCHDREKLLTQVASAGLHPTSPDVTFISITEPLFLRVMVAGLDDPCANVRREARDSLERNVRPEHLAPYAAAIKAARARDQTAVSPLLLSRLPLNDAERTALLDERKDSLDGPLIRARLGDHDAEAAFIARFEQASTYNEKQEAARLLGLIGTHAAGAVLAGALKSGIVNDSEFGTTSIRFSLIAELAKLNPDEPLLTREYRRLVVAGGDAGYGGPEAVRTYLDRIYDWARRTYGVALDGPEPPPILFQPKRTGWPE